MDLFSELKDIKFVTTLVLKFKKIQSDDKTLYSTLYSTSKAETIINESDTDDVFESIYCISHAIPQLVAVISNYQNNYTIQEKV